MIEGVIITRRRKVSDDERYRDYLVARQDAERELLALEAELGRAVQSDDLIYGRRLA